MILVHAADLLWATKIRATADACGVAVRPVRNVEMLEARLADSPVRGLVVDLDAPEIAMALIARVRQEFGPAAVGKPFGDPVSGPAKADPAQAIRVLAFGPHVAVQALHAAKAAGADVVMTRGAFNARLGETLRNLEQPRGKGLADVLED